MTKPLSGEQRAWLRELGTLVGEAPELWSARAESWQALVSAGVLRGVPLDPAGAPYRYDAARGAVELDTRSPLAPLPAEFQR